MWRIRYISAQPPSKLRFLSLGVLCSSVPGTQNVCVWCVNDVMAAGLSSSSQAQRYPDKCSFNDILTNLPSKRKTNWNGSLLNPGSLRDNPNDPEPKNFAARLRTCSAVCGRTPSCRKIAPRRHFPWPLNAWAIIRTAQRDQFSQAGHRVVLPHVLTRKHVLWIKRARTIQSPLPYVPTW
jgi:hypothetical protein